jgi:hypothetical protein
MGNPAPLESGASLRRLLGRAVWLRGETPLGDDFWGPNTKRPARGPDSAHRSDHQNGRSPTIFSRLAALVRPVSSIVAGSPQTVLAGPTVFFTPTAILRSTPTLFPTTGTALLPTPHLFRGSWLIVGRRSLPVGLSPKGVPDPPPTCRRCLETRTKDRTIC